MLGARSALLGNRGFDRSQSWRLEGALLALPGGESLLGARSALLGKRGFDRFVPFCGSRDSFYDLRLVSAITVAQRIHSRYKPF